MSMIKYLQQNMKLLILGLFFCVFPGVMIALNEEEKFLESDGFYCITVLLFVFLIYILCDFVGKNKFCKELKKLQGSNELDFVVSLPEAKTYEQDLYTKLLLRLKANIDDTLLNVEAQKEEDMEFVETWVHEIKTPISAAKLVIENNLDDPKEETLYALLDEIQKIEDMVQKTICYSQLNDFSKDCQISDVNLRKVVNKCIQSEYSNIQNKNIQLKIENLDFTVNSDGKWLGFIVKQILDNAVKYSKTNGVISIYGINEHYNQRLVITDYGVGIRAEDVRRVFDKGYTGMNGRKKTTSTGIGLYLSNKLAKKLGHNIRIESESGKGTVVEISIQE